MFAKALDPAYLVATCDTMDGKPIMTGQTRGSNLFAYVLEFADNVNQKCSSIHFANHVNIF
jgi:hypothetical protein